MLYDSSTCSAVIMKPSMFTAQEVHYGNEVKVNGPQCEAVKNVIY